jgi:hypothetical protein
MKKLTQKQFRLPNAPNLNSRKSTIAKALSDGISPRLRPTESQFEEYSKFFPKKEGGYDCAYCGNSFHYMEHFRPLVIELFPTGYGSDIYNLVPSCKNCNEKKKNDPWIKWMNDKDNPGIVDIEAHSRRFAILEQFQDWGESRVIHIPYKDLIGEEKWNEYIKQYRQVLDFLKNMNELQKEIKNEVNKHLKIRDVN